MAAGSGLCRHCGRLVGLSARGLCGPCWRQPAVRALYPAARRGPAPVAGGHPRDDAAGAEVARRISRRLEREWWWHVEPGELWGPAWEAVAASQARGRRASPRYVRWKCRTYLAERDGRKVAGGWVPRCVGAQTTRIDLGN